MSRNNNNLNCNENNEIGRGNRDCLKIDIEDRTRLLLIPRISERMQAAIPPDPIPTPTIVCPSSGFKGLKFASEFNIKFTPPECCGGMRECEIFINTDNNPLMVKPLICLGRINSETEVFLQREKEEGKEQREELMGMRFDAASQEWSISFPELETVAYMTKPKTKISNNQIYEVFSAENRENYFNLGVDYEKDGEEFVFKFLNSNLAPIARMVVVGNYKSASIVFNDENLWPSQKAVILGVGVMVAWEVVQEIRRKLAWVRVIIAVAIILTILVALLVVNVYVGRTLN